MSPRNSVCVVAILRDEVPFIDEWLVYHRLIGVDYFYLYDDGQEPLDKVVQPHRDYTALVPWFGWHEALPGRNRQTKAYTHSLSEIRSRFEWVCFLDLDEYIVLRRHADLRSFLSDVVIGDSVSLFWRNFGHNGYYEDPEGLVTECLTRRKRQSGRQCKSITRVEAIQSIESAHRCVLRPGSVSLDANGHNFLPDAWNQDMDGTMFNAYVNHYYCRSFLRWMNRPVRGATTDEETLPGEAWKLDTDQCLRRFVTTVAVEFNEQIDNSMRQFAELIRSHLEELDIHR